MFERLLLYVDEQPETQAATAQALRLARHCDARIFAVSVLARTAPAGSPRAMRSRRGRGSSSEPEETAWARLYEIEDDAFKANVRISLLLESGDRDEKLLALIESYRLDALIVGTRSLEGWTALIERCPVAVIIAKQQKLNNIAH